ncbi:biotin transporter BioY [Microbacterium pseudoresistens]|uniref:Biotin transporter n=1 Tax=Microbacterium pseudoresistens TaxID=640634 RepID=A0A7Y9EX50_9MICO|nr:biotin transporter BioY [Microbacterium pseudoresistens]NYD55376.1 biotin transport system substrate-specific component [Microbacterium pseudoresistens]
MATPAPTTSDPISPSAVATSTAARPLAGDLARIAVFAALIIALGLVTIPLAGGVPLTGQTLGVMLAGLVLGSRRAPMAILTVLALAAAGLPVLAGGRGGLGVFVGPTAGYLLGWIVGVVVIGLIARSGRFSWWRTALAATIGGIVVVYAFGVPVQALVTQVPLGPTALSSLVFLPGDAIKVAVATLLVVGLHRAYPRAFAGAARAR